MSNPQLNTPSMTQITTRSKIFAVVAVVVFLAALAGIFSRPLFFLASFWPANALLLGLILRFPQLRGIETWLGAFTGFMLADLITGNYFLLTFALTLANLFEVLTAIVLFQLFQLNYRKYNHGLTFFYMLLIVTASSALSAFAAVMTVPLLPNSFIDDQHLFQEFTMWWTTEIQNHVLILPLILSLPSWQNTKRFIQDFEQIEIQWHDFLPLFAIIASTAVAVFFGGPGALTFPIAALIWAALRYGFFSLAIINFVVCTVLFYSITLNLPDAQAADYLYISTSTRIGLFMMAISAMTVCLISSNRKHLFEEVLFHVQHDSLTKSLSRLYFMESANSAIDQSHKHELQTTLMMVDIDHFKRINDEFGHQAGDKALQHFVNVTKSILRQSDLFGRLGGEEFAILLQDTDIASATLIAERIQAALKQYPLIITQGQSLQIKISIGLLSIPSGQMHQTLDYWISQADKALYQAKSAGRDQIHIAFNA
ncbi:GGDEF domain-containing protein [Acinetobacter marinus]|nr:GGDEF domain-containing protein [Acinetobacter marinus]